MLVTVEKSDLLLSQSLAKGKFMPDMRCGGNGTCRRCRVKLISGVWEENGRIVSAPVEVLSCRTKLLSDSGEIDIVPIPESGKISADWNSFPLPAKPETVIAIDIGTTTIAGAIDHYFGTGEYTVLGNIAPDGLCGSGMVDYLAVERTAGHLNEFGRIQPKNEYFELAPGVKIHGCDIEQLLKAKAAVWAGVQTLESHIGAEAQ